VSGIKYKVEREVTGLSDEELLSELKKLYLGPPFGVLDEPILQEIQRRMALRFQEYNHALAVRQAAFYR
jgi:hypothetical protein